MGLLEGLLGAAMGAMNQSGNNNQAQAGGGAGGALLNIALEMLSNRGQAGGQAGGMGGMGSVLGGLGGLGGLLQALQQNGLGNVGQSWVSSGSNMPISAEQLQQVLGNDRIGQIAQQLGLPAGQISEQLAGMLPEVVDRLTPQGEMPQGGLGDPQELLQSLTRALRG